METADSEQSPVWGESQTITAPSKAGGLISWGLCSHGLSPSDSNRASSSPAQACMAQERIEQGQGFSLRLDKVLPKAVWLPRLNRTKLR